MRIRSLAAIAVVSALAVACGGSASLSPTSPTSVTGGSSTTTTISGVVNNGTAATSAGLANGTLSLASTITVSVAGTSVSAPVSANGQFTLTNVPPGDVVLQFAGPGVDARVTISAVTSGATITINVLVGGSSAVVTHEDRVEPNNKTEVEGLIGAIQAATRTITVDSRVISVPATATIRKGDRAVAFADLLVGQRVHVKATQDGSNLVATEVIVQNEDPHGADDLNRQIRGAVTAATGTCPAITFTVAAVSVTANGATDYRNGVCADVKTGAVVDVTAMKNTGGTFVATRVSFTK